MDINSNTIIQGIISFLSILVVSLWTPKVKWGIEKKRKQMENRQHLLDSVKKLLAQEECDKDVFFDSLEYKNLRPYIREETQIIIDKIGKDRPTVKGGAIHIPLISLDENPIDLSYKQLICDEIARLEKEWKLM